MSYSSAKPVRRLFLAASAVALVIATPAIAAGELVPGNAVALAQAQTAAKPTLKSAPVKPAVSPGTVAETAPTAAPAAQPGSDQGGLGGAWRISWLRPGKVTNLMITSEKGQPGIVGFDSVLGSLAGSDCKGGGFAARTLGGVFPVGGDVNMVGVADYVCITTQCTSGQVLLEALGVTGKPLQWVGRAVMIDASGARTFESFVMQR